MKKKSRPNIPDFSKKRPSTPAVAPHDVKHPQQPPRAASPTPTIKPHSTSMKSGRRGS